MGTDARYVQQCTCLSSCTHPDNAGTRRIAGGGSTTPATPQARKVVADARVAAAAAYEARRVRPRPSVDVSDLLQGLDAQQRAACDNALQGNSVFVTGAAGNGKTHTVRCLVRALRRVGHVVVCLAPTWVTARHVCQYGRSMHKALNIPVKDSFGGHRLSAADPASIQAAVRSFLGKYPHLRRRCALYWQQVSVLVLDEISLAGSVALWWSHFFLSEVRSPAPMGGLQLVVSGAVGAWCVLQYLRRLFLSLVRVPVGSSGDYMQLPCPSFSPSLLDFAFNVPVFPPMAAHVLTGNHRHSGDAAWASLLGRARLGAMTRDDVARLEELRETTFPAQVTPLVVFPLRRETPTRAATADGYNKKMLAELSPKGPPSWCHQSRWAAKARPCGSRRAPVSETEVALWLESRTLVPFLLELKVRVYCMLRWRHLHSMRADSALFYAGRSTGDVCWIAQVFQTVQWCMWLCRGSFSPLRNVPA